MRFEVDAVREQRRAVAAVRNSLRRMSTWLEPAIWTVARNASAELSREPGQRDDAIRGCATTRPLQRGDRGCRPTRRVRSSSCLRSAPALADDAQRSGRAPGTTARCGTRCGGASRCRPCLEAWLPRPRTRRRPHVDDVAVGIGVRGEGEGRPRRARVASARTVILILPSPGANAVLGVVACRDATRHSHSSDRRTPTGGCRRACHVPGLFACHRPTSLFAWWFISAPQRGHCIVSVMPRLRSRRSHVRSGASRPSRSARRGTCRPTGTNRRRARRSRRSVSSRC